MKINVELDIEWLDEEETIDDAVKAGIINAVVKKVKTSEIVEKVQKKIDTVINDEIEKTLESNVTKTYDEFVSKEISIADRYGDVTKVCTIHDLIRDKFDEYFMADVDEKGNAWNGNSYGTKRGKRMERMISDQLEKFGKAFTKDTIDTLEEKISTTLSEQLKERVSSTIMEHTGLNKLIGS